MLKIITKLSELRFSDLMQIYSESNIANGKEKYPTSSSFDQLREAELDFYEYLRSVFFRQEHSFYAIWEEEGRFQSALRIEPYSDGLLLCALETVPNARHRGYASALISSVIAYLSRQGNGTIYSHVSKKNIASVKVHQKCGFCILNDHAVYSDGSVLHDSYTLTYKYEKSET